MAGLVPAIPLREALPIQICSPHGAKRNAGAGEPHATLSPNFASLHPGYACYACFFSSLTLPLAKRDAPRILFRDELAHSRTTNPVAKLYCV